MSSKCRKKRFGSYDEAGLALVSAKIRRYLKHQQNRREERVYFCDTCNGFHLTSMPLAGKRS